MLVSGNAALHTNSDRHFTASWNESIAAAKCCWKVFTEAGEEEKKTGNLCGSKASEKKHSGDLNRFSLLCLSFKLNNRRKKVI